jgi:hypothetical protein
MRQLNSHLVYWVLTETERRTSQIIWWPTINLIPGWNLISVYNLQRDEELNADQAFPWLVWFYWVKVWIIIDVPIIKNPYSNWEDTDHMVIDGKEVPIEQRKITWILISEKNIWDKEKISEIVNIAQWKSLPIYSMDHWFELKKIA